MATNCYSATNLMFGTIHEHSQKFLNFPPTTANLRHINRISDKCQGDFFNVRKSMHHHTIHINQLKTCKSFTGLLLDVFVWLNMFRAPLRPSSGAYNCTRSLWFYRQSAAVGTLLVVAWQTTINNAPTVKPEAPSCSCTLLMMGEKAPETC